ncbi:aldehyde oxidase GLOX [Carya illinoinensis]|nr:aldehyde oxidase GLOX [Carya illinoinensis]
MASKNPSLLILFPIFSVLIGLSLYSVRSSSAVEILKPSPAWMGGKWNLLHSSIGVSAMHMQLLKNDKVIIFDRMDTGPSNLSLPIGESCVLKRKKPADCTAHSLLYDLISGTVRPLLVKTDTWCSSGAVFPDGTLVQTGGYHDGDRVVRKFTPCDDETCDWKELRWGLENRRWYATNQLLPDGRVIIMGGRQVYTYEFFPKSSVKGSSSSSYYMSFLRETTDRYADENNLYPFLHLMPDGNLFVFANKRSILFDYKRNRVVKEFPVIPGKFKRNYPSTGSSVLLPLRLNGTDFPEAEVMVCGGAPEGAFNMSDTFHVFISASNTCGRLRVTDPKPQWVMEEMPMPRIMSDMILLPTGDLILINGAMNGTAGWEDAMNPVYHPVLYRPNDPRPERRFVVLNPSMIPRMYHSTAILLSDGSILVGGSNPHQKYNFTARPFPTELSLEAYRPYYMYPRFSPQRPSILSVESEEMSISYGQTFWATFVLNMYRPESGISVALIAPSFTTHSLAMNQRMVILEVTGLEQLSILTYKITVNGPPTATVAPPGYYMFFVVHAGIPSHAVWVKIQ